MKEGRESLEEERKRDSFPPLEVDIESYTSMRYEYEDPKFGTYTTRKPTLSELIEYKAQQGKLQFYSKAKTFLGFRLAVPSWTDCYVAVTQDKFYFYKAVDELDRVTDFTFELEDCVVTDVGETQGKKYVFCVSEKRGQKLFFAAYDYTEYLRFVNATRRGSTLYRLALPKYFNDRAFKIQNVYKGHKERVRYRIMLKGFIRLQAVYKGQKARKQYKKMVKAVITLQGFGRIVLAKKQKEFARLQGNVEKYHMKRTYILKEMVETEESYVQDLGMTINVFKKPIKAIFDDNEKNRSALKKSENDKDANQTEIFESMTEVFSNIEDIHKIHEGFLVELKKKKDHWHETEKIGDLFVELSTKLDIYVPYCTNYEIALSTIRAAKKNEKFQEFLNATNGIKKLKKLDLFGFLILPIQRIPRYVLLLNDFLKHTWKAHPDYAKILEAIGKMQKVAGQLNEAKKKDEERKKAITIASKFKDPSSQNVTKEIITNGAGILWEGPVISNHLCKESDDPKKYIKTYMLLFTDQIVLTKRTVEKKIDGRRFKLSQTVKFSEMIPIPISDITEKCEALPQGEHQPHGFLVVTKNHNYKFFTKTVDSKTTCIGHINKATGHN